MKRRKRSINKEKTVLTKNREKTGTGPNEEVASRTNRSGEKAISGTRGGREKTGRKEMEKRRKATYSKGIEIRRDARKRNTGGKTDPLAGEQPTS